MREILRSPSVAIVTSRLKRLVHPNQAWLAGLRGVLRQIADDGSRLILIEGTAGSNLIGHTARRLGIPICEIAASTTSNLTDDVSPSDRNVMESADVVYVLQLRANGNIHRLLRERLEHPKAGIVLVDLPGLQAELVKNDLCDQGAVLWSPTENQSRPLDNTSGSGSECNLNSIAATEGVYTIIPFPSAQEWEFLVHTTRSCPGPWPEESFEQYADSLLESRSDADHSTLGTLRRIVAQKKLIASNQTIRGGSRVVSLTARPLSQLPALHRFRPHRVRWDFEPFGLCLRREWLINQGVRSVHYGDDAVWQSLSDADRPFFQLATGDSGIDWTVEQEWRALGDLNLANLSQDDVILFVPDFQSAKSLAQVTSWPITLWPGMEG
jgi:hypothetical protein